MKNGVKMFKKGKNHGTIAHSYPLFLLMIHHEETWLKPNPNPNLNKRGYESAIAPKRCLLPPELWLLKCKTWLFLYFLLMAANN